MDSTAATALMQTLRELADAGKTIVAVIHQPSQHVFAKFDDVLLLAEGNNNAVAVVSLNRAHWSLWAKHD